MAYETVLTGATMIYCEIPENLKKSICDVVLAAPNELVINRTRKIAYREVKRMSIAGMIARMNYADISFAANVRENDNWWDYWPMRQF